MGIKGMMPSMVLENDVMSARQARALVSSALAGRETEVRTVAVLLADELVANAIVHSSGPISVSVDVSGNGIRVEVFDGDERDPVLKDPAPGEVHGRGMRLVDYLASSWGVEKSASGKCVWFRLEFARRDD